MVAYNKVEHVIINTVFEICFQNFKHRSMSFADKNKTIIKNFIVPILNFRLFSWVLLALLLLFIL